MGLENDRQILWGLEMQDRKLRTKLWALENDGPLFVMNMNRKNVL